MVKASKFDIDQVMSWKNRKKDSTGKAFDWTKQQRISNSIRVLKLGAQVLYSNKMIIEGDSFDKLIEKYYGGKKND